MSHFKELSIIDPKDVALTFQSLKIGDINSRFCSYSNEFEVIGFEDNPQDLYIGKFEFNGSEAFDSCRLTVLGREGSVYKVRLYSFEKVLFEAVGDKLLTDLNLDAYSHIWNITNILAGQTRDGGWCYPLVEYGGAETSFTLSNPDDNDVYCEKLYPSFYLHTLIKEIIEQAGFKHIAFAGANYLNKVLPFSKKEFEFNDAEYRSQREVILTRSTWFMTTTPNNIPFDTKVVDVLNQVAMPAGTVLEVQGGHSLYLKLSFDTITDDFVFNVQVNGTTVSTFVLTSASSGLIFEPFQTGYAVTSGDQVTIQAAAVSGGFNLLGIRAEYSVTQAAVFGSTVIRPSYHLPKIKQSDVLKFVLQYYCLIPVITDDVVEFQELNSLTDFEDWRAYIDYGNEPKRTYHSSLAQRNYVTYKDAKNKATVVINDATLSHESVLYEFTFQEVDIFGQRLFAYENGAAIEIGEDDGAYLIDVEGIDANAPGIGFQHSGGVNLQAEHMQARRPDVNEVITSHSAYIAMMQDFESMTVRAVLPRGIEIKQMQLIAAFDEHWYVDSIQNMQENGECTLNLIKWNQ